MAVLLERRVSTAAGWSRRLAFFAAALLIASVVGHRTALVDTIALFWLFGIVVCLALTAILLALLGFFRLWEYGDRGGRNSTKGTLAALLVLTPFAYGAFLFFAFPGLTDISTDTIDPPTFHHARKVRSPLMNPLQDYSGADAVVQVDRYPEITGRRYPLSQAIARDISFAVAADLGWAALGAPRTGAFGRMVTFEFAAPSPVVGFVSDVAVRLIDEGDAIYVDLRSTARYGRHDLGDNAVKIGRFFAALEEEIAERNALFLSVTE